MDLQSPPEATENLEIEGVPQGPDSHAAIVTRSIDSLLEREVAAEYRQEWTRIVAQREERQRNNAVSIFIFRLGAEWMSLPMARIQRVVGSAPLHTMPHRRGILLGLVSVNGDLLLCVSLARLLGIDSDTEGGLARSGVQHRHFIVAAGEKGSLAFPVDEVHGIHRYYEEELHKVPSTLAEATAIYTTAVLPWKEHAVGCLDDQMLFYAVNKNLS